MVKNYKKIGLVDLSTQQNRLSLQIEQRIHTVLSHGQYIMGPEVRELEDRLSAFVGSRFCISTGSGTEALLIALLALGVGAGDAVITTPFTFMATAEAIALVGATPLFVDIDPQTYNLNSDHLEAALAAASGWNSSKYPLPRPPSGTTLSLKVRGVIPVDLFGLPADYDRIEDLGHKYGLFVLADAAQSLGSIYKGRRAGSFGTIATTSFFPAKPLGAYGDGGALFTSDENLAEALRSIRVHGMGSEKYENIRLGLNGRLDTLQAAILLAKLELFSEELDRRQEIASRYSASLGDLPGIVTPAIPSGYRSAWAQYSLRVRQRKQLSDLLEREGISSAIYYPRPLHLQPGFQDLGYRQGDFPIAEAVCKEILSIPVHPYLSSEDVTRVIDVIRTGARNGWDAS